MIVHYSNKYSKPKNDLVKLFQQISLVVFGCFFGLMVICLFIFKNNPNMKFQSLIALSVGYIAWALFHHYLEKTLHLEIVIEYLLIASLVLIVLSSVLVL